MTEPMLRPLPERARAAAARATYALREAELLVGLGSVVGAADDVPAAAELGRWARDWAERARRALARAAELAGAPERELRERGRRIATRLREGAAAARRAAREARQPLAEPVRDALRAIERAAAGLGASAAAGAIAALALAWLVLGRGR